MSNKNKPNFIGVIAFVFAMSTQPAYAMVSDSLKVNLITWGLVLLTFIWGALMFNAWQNVKKSVQGGASPKDSVRKATTTMSIYTFVYVLLFALVFFIESIFNYFG